MLKKAQATFRDNSDRIKRLVRESGWILAGQIVSIIGGLTLVKVLTGYLDPEEYGRLALGLTVASLVNQVVTGGVSNAVGRYYSIALEWGDIWGYLRAYRKLMIYAMLAIAFIGFILAILIYVVDEDYWFWLLVAVLSFSIISGYNSTFSSIQNAARQRSVVAFHSGLDTWLKIGFAIVAIYWLGTNSTTVVIGYIASAFFIALSQLFFLRRLIYSTEIRDNRISDNNWVKQMWQYLWPTMAGGLFNWGYYASQRWALEVFVSTDDVGKFYALTQIAYVPIVHAGSFFLSFLMPIMYSRIGDPKNKNRIENVLSIIIKIAVFGTFMTLLLSVFLFFTHGMIFELFVAEKYQGFSVYMPLLVIAAGFHQVSLSLSIYVLSQNKTRLFLRKDIIGNSIVVILNFIFTWAYGVVGLVLSMVIGAIIQLVWVVIIVSNSKESNGSFENSVAEAV